MKRIDNRTVSLTDREIPVKDSFEGLLIEGLSIPEAAVKALREAQVKDPEFVAYLSEGTCHVVKGRVTVKKEWRTTEVKPLPSAAEMRAALGLA